MEFFDALETIDELELDHLDDMAPGKGGPPTMEDNGGATRAIGRGVGNGGVNSSGGEGNGEGSGGGLWGRLPPPTGFDALTPQEQVAAVVAEGGVPFELCGKAWEQKCHVERVSELVSATKDRVAREKGIDRSALRAQTVTEADTAPEPLELSLYDQARGVIGRMQLGQDITKFELPATFLTPFSAIQATEDVLTIISGTERELPDWQALSDPALTPLERFTPNPKP